MSTKCLITANREEAKIFSIDNGKLEFIKKFENPDGASKNREFMTDKPGAKPAGGSGLKATHSVAAGKDPKNDVEVAFTKFLAKNLPKEIISYSEIIFAAEPRFQGLLKSELKRHSPQTMIRWLSEDWNNLPSAKIEGLLKS